MDVFDLAALGSSKEPQVENIVQLIPLHGMAYNDQLCVRVEASFLLDERPSEDLGMDQD